MSAAAEPRHFAVHVRDEDAHHAGLVLESSFEAAAVAYLEHHPHTLFDSSEISLIVRDVASGRQHCFRIDLETGAAAPCG